MTSAYSVRGALSTLADYTFGTLIAMVQLALADREVARQRFVAAERSVRVARDRELA
jgi:hypothetical protein